MSMLDGNSELLCPPDAKLLSLLRLGNMFQNLKVSSPAPVTMLDPHGDMLKYNTL